MNNPSIPERVEEIRRKYESDSMEHDESVLEIPLTVVTTLLTETDQQAREEIETKIKEVTLTTAQSTKIMSEILESYSDMVSNWAYKAPEVIELEKNEFLWNLYISGRVGEKEDILTALSNPPSQV